MVDGKRRVAGSRNTPSARWFINDGGLLDRRRRRLRQPGRPACRLPWPHQREERRSARHRRRSRRRSNRRVQRRACHVYRVLCAPRPLPTTSSPDIPGAAGSNAMSGSVYVRFTVPTDSQRLSRASCRSRARRVDVRRADAGHRCPPMITSRRWLSSEPAQDLKPASSIRDRADPADLHYHPRRGATQGPLPRAGWPKSCSTTALPHAAAVDVTGVTRLRAAGARGRSLPRRAGWSVSNAPGADEHLRVEPSLRLDAAGHYSHWRRHPPWTTSTPWFASAADHVALGLTASLTLSFRRCAIRPRFLAVTTHHRYRLCGHQSTAFATGSGSALSVEGRPDPHGRQCRSRSRSRR